MVVMLRPSFIQQRQNMRDQGKHRLERGSCSLWRARQVHDQGRAPDCRDSAAQGCELRLFSAFRAHHFGEAVEHSSADRPRGFWSDIPGGNSRASCGDHQPRLLGLLAERIFNRMLLIRHYDMAGDGEAVLFEKLDNRGTGDIDALSSKPGIANGNDCGAEHK